MFSARKAKAAPPRQQSVAPQIERSTTGSSLDDSNESARRGDVALCCAYVLQGSDWAPVNNSRPDDLARAVRISNKNQSLAQYITLLVGIVDLVNPSRLRCALDCCVLSAVFGLHTPTPQG